MIRLLDHSTLSGFFLQNGIRLPNSTYQCQTVLTNAKQYLPIPNNTKQYLSNLVLAGLALHQQYIEYRRQYNSSIIMVLSRHGSDGFLTVWYRNGTDSGYLHKIFDA